MFLRRNTGLLFALPALIVLFMLIAYPVVYTGLLSVTDNKGNVVGLSNFAAVLKPRVTTQAFINTLWWVGGSVIAQVILGTATAVLLNQNFWGRSIVRSLTLLPWVVPGIVAATTWAWMFHTEFGIINYMMTSTGAVPKAINWLGDPNLVMPVLIAINVWKLFPFVAIMVLAGLQSIPRRATVELSATHPGNGSSPRGRSNSVTRSTTSARQALAAWNSSSRRTRGAAGSVTAKMPIGPARSM